MTQTVAVVDALKAHLRARKMTYSEVAKSLKMSEASVKRLFSRHHFTLDRFERICALAGTSLTQLARDVDNAGSHISQLTLQQEKEIVRDRKLLLVAVCALNQLTLEQIVDTYTLSKTECIQLLLKLDRIKFLELLPDNRIKLLVTRTFAWLPDGPIQQYFKKSAFTEYFRANFDGADQVLLLVNGMLSQASTQRMLARLRRVANEFSEMHVEDAKLPLGERRSASVVVAMRPWELDDFHAMRRGKKGAPVAKPKVG